MKKNKKYWILGVALLFLFIFVIIAGTTRLATDSGWDTDYDTGSSSSSGDADLIFLLFRLILLVIEEPVIGIPAFIFVGLFLIFALSSGKPKKVDHTKNMQWIANNIVDTANRPILLNCYQIFYDTQMAWMNFDYEKLRQLLTDELYNSYKNQLDALKLKGQKNIMDNFTVKRIELRSKKVEENVETTEVFLSVSFYDYVVDANGKVVRGKKSTMVHMQYKLTFVANIKAEEICPNCGAPLTKPNLCDYCKSPIQGLSTNRRLAKKEVMNQITGGM